MILGKNCYKLRKGIAMKKNKMIAAMMFVLLVLCGSTSAFAATTDYSQWSSGGTYPSDIVNTEYFTAVKILMDRGVISGDTDGLFHPENNITRAEFAKMMALSTNNATTLDSDATSTKFSDLSGYSWAQPYINAVARAGIMEGVGNGKFVPWRNVTYAEAVTAIIRTTNSSYNQIISSGTWPQNVINYAQMYNVAGDTLIYDWNSAATRGNIAKLIYRNMPKSSTTAGSATLSAATINAGVASTVSVAAGATGVTTTYQWYRIPVGTTAGVAIAGANGNTLSVAVPVLGDKYYVVITTQKVGYNPTSVTSGNCTVI